MCVYSVIGGLSGNRLSVESRRGVYKLIYAELVIVPAKNGEQQDESTIALSTQQLWSGTGLCENAITLMSQLPRPAIIISPRRCVSDQEYLVHLVSKLTIRHNDRTENIIAKFCTVNIR